MNTKNNANSHSCRLCSGRLSTRFKLIILEKYPIQYYQCEQCHSLQTQPVYWLEEAYSKNLSNLDTGAVQRNWHNFYVIYILCHIFKLKNLLDLGGGDGLLCRSLRDYEINCYVQDEYASPNYAQGFTEPDFENPDLVLAFEVWEHLANPALDLNKFFGKNPKMLLVSTSIYTNQGADWWYLTPESGQHIFFYSQQALENIAKLKGYELHIIENFILFMRKDCASTLKLNIFKRCLRGKLNRYLKYKIMRKSPTGVWKDYLKQKERENSTFSSFK